MDEDDLTEAHTRQVLLAGAVVAELTDDPRGTRYVVRGCPKGSKRQVEVVCRLLPSGVLRIITVYAAKE